METTTTKDVTRELMIRFSCYRIPSFLNADNAPQISSDCKEFYEFCSTNGIKLLNTIPYWPQSNGEVEGQNRSILNSLFHSFIHSFDSLKKRGKSTVTEEDKRRRAILNRVMLYSLSGCERRTNSTQNLLTRSSLWMVLTLLYSRRSLVSNTGDVQPI